MIVKDDKPSKTQECLEDAFNENNYGVKIIDEDGDDVTKAFILENKELYDKGDWDAIMDNYTQNDYYLSVANPPIEE